MAESFEQQTDIGLRELAISVTGDAKRTTKRIVKETRLENLNSSINALKEKVDLGIKTGISDIQQGIKNPGARVSRLRKQGKKAFDALKSKVLTTLLRSFSASILNCCVIVLTFQTDFLKLICRNSNKQNIMVVKKIHQVQDGTNDPQALIQKAKTLKSKFRAKVLTYAHDNQMEEKVSNLAVSMHLEGVGKKILSKGSEVGERVAAMAKTCGITDTFSAVAWVCKKLLPLCGIINNYMPITCECFFSVLKKMFVVHISDPMP